MKIKYLGTAAYEGIPSLFCECETCKKARAFKGKNIRTRSQALINDDLLIDFPPDTLVHANTYGIDFQRIHHYLSPIFFVRLLYNLKISNQCV